MHCAVNQRSFRVQSHTCSATLSYLARSLCRLRRAHLYRRLASVWAWRLGLCTSILATSSRSSSPGFSHRTQRPANPCSESTSWAVRMCCPK